MKHTNKSKTKLTSSQKKELRRRIKVLRGKYKGKGLMKALMAEKEHEKES